MHFYRHHIGDFVRATSRLTDMQCMAYLRMLWMYYENEEPLDCDVDAIAFKIGANASDVAQILKHFFFLHDGRWHNSRCDKEILEFRSKSEKARTSANARWENANALRKQSDGNANEPVFDANHKPITSNQEPKNKKEHTAAVPAAVPAPRAVRKIDDEKLEETFARFWAVYDHKVGRHKALKVWKQINPDDELVETILKAAARYSRANPDRVYYKHPSTWLTNRHWEDDPGAVKPRIAMPAPQRPTKTQHQLNQEAIARSIGLIPKEPERTIIDGGVVYDITESTPKLLG